MIQSLECELEDAADQTKNSECRFLTSKELADYLTTSGRTVTRLREKKELNAHKFGGQYRYKESDIIAWPLEHKYKNNADDSFFSGFSIRYDESKKPIPLITTRELKEILRNSLRTVYRFIDDDIPAFVVGGQKRVDRPLLEKWVTKHKY